MGALECAGCAMITFGPPLSLFFFIISPDPLRVIILVTAAFFWLLSLFASSLLWFAVVPLRNYPAFGLFFSVGFQELFRYLYYRLLTRAERGLNKLSTKGMHIEGIHSLKNAKHTTAFVAGLGFGVMSGLFSVMNILADGSGPGTLGLPTLLGLSTHYATYTFFITSSIFAGAMILLHVAWNVLFWHGCEKKNYAMIAIVLFSHTLVSGLSLLNQMDLWYVSISVAWVILLAQIFYSYLTAGGSWSDFVNSLKCIFTGTIPTPPPSQPDSLEANQPGVDVSTSSPSVAS